MDNILLTLIARVSDGLILATSIEGADNVYFFIFKLILNNYFKPDHNMVKYMSQAKVIFRKLNSPNTPQIQSITSGQYFFQ